MPFMRLFILTWKATGMWWHGGELPEMGMPCPVKSSSVSRPSKRRNRAEGVINAFSALLFPWSTAYKIYYVKYLNEQTGTNSEDCHDRHYPFSG